MTAGQAAKKADGGERGRWPLGFWVAILGIAIELFGLYGRRMGMTPSTGAVAVNPAGDELRTREPLARSSASESPVSKRDIEKDWVDVQKIMNRANRLMKSIKDSKGRIRKQERWGDFLEPVAEIKFRQTVEPFRMHLKWIEPHPGREVLFNEDQDPQQLTVLESTPLGGLAPTFLISVDHKIAKQVSRHPIPEFSLDWLRGEMRRYVNRAARDTDATLWLDKKASVSGVPCVHVQLTHGTPKGVGPKKYQRVDLFFRKDDSFPIRWEKYGEFQDDGQDPKLVEFIEVLDLEANPGMDGKDFAVDHPDFGFGKLIIPLN